jgi:glycogen(starch) synthase
LKIAVISNLYPPHIVGGYEALCQATVTALGQRGHDILVLTSNHGLLPDVKYPQEPGIRRVFDLERPFGNDGDDGAAPLSRRAEIARLNADRCLEQLEAFRPDVVFVWSQDRLTLGPALAAESMRVPSVFFLCDDHLRRYLPRPFTAKPAELLVALAERSWRKNLTLEALDIGRSLCISRSLRSNLSTAGLPLSHAEILTPGIDVERYPLKENAGRMHRPARLLYLGPQRPNKRVEIILRALGILHDNQRNRVMLTVAGDGDPDYVARLKGVAEDLGVSRETLFMGRVDYDLVPQFYRDHDIFVYASIWDEPFGLTHLEAMASGCPVVSTDCGGPTEYLENEHNALVVERDNPVELAEAVGSVLQNAVLRRNLIEEARRTVETKFRAGDCLDRLEACLLKAAGMK